MIVNELRGFADKWDEKHPMDASYAVLVMTEGQKSEEVLAEVHKLGYACYVRTTELGEEVVVIDAPPISAVDKRDD